MPNDALRRTSLYLRKRQLSRLEKLSERTGAPVAELIRRLIDAGLDALERKGKRGGEQHIVDLRD